ncbi:hypothetical protein WR25_17112 [Diploscapter pachys]|uniref:Uncharacterized protein n=1 Tax=Diploscapter pachys TaxID=2018661 RepID=A0A2A2M237_9BILA|nr:hypothetical protein WR25_17112 [Diploscapter pachys]
MAQRPGRRGPARLQRLPQHGQHGDHDGEHGRPQEEQRRQADPIHEPCQPRPHREERDRPGDEVGDQHRPQELPDQQLHDIARRRTQRLADPDLLDPPRGVERGKPPQTDATDHHRQPCADRKQPRRLLVGLVEVIEPVIRALAAERHLRRHPLPDRLHLRQRDTRIACHPHARDGHERRRLGRVVIIGRHGRRARRSEAHIGNDPDDRTRTVAADRLPDGLIRRTETQRTDRLHRDDDVLGRPGWSLTVVVHAMRVIEQPPRHRADAMRLEKVGADIDPVEHRAVSRPPRDRNVVAAHAAAAAHGEVGKADRLDHRQRADRGDDGIGLARTDLGTRQRRDHQQAVAPEPDIGGAHIARLCDQHRSADHEGDGEAELENDQRLARPRPRPAAARRSVEARRDAGDDRQYDQRRHHDLIGNRQRQAPRRIDQRQPQLGQDQSTQRRHRDGQHGFAQELANERAATAPQHFTHRDLPRAQPRARRGEIDVIDQRDQQRQHADDAQRHHRLALPVADIVGQMHPGQRIHRKAYRFRRLRPHVAHAMPLDERRHLVFERLRSRRCVEAEIGRQRRAAPVRPLLGTPRLRQLDQHRELPFGRRGKVVEDALDLILLWRAATGGDRHHLTDGVGGPEIFACQAFADEQAGRRGDTLPPVPLHHRNVEDVEEGGIDLRHVLRRRDAVAQHAAAILAAVEAGANDFWEIALQFIEQPAHRLGRRAVIFTALHVPDGFDQIDLVMIRQPFFEARLEPDVQAQHQEYGDAHGKAADVERGVELVPGQRAVQRQKREAVHGVPPQIARMALATMRPSSIASPSRSSRPRR